MSDKAISVFEMTRDPRLRRLFALVGRTIADNELYEDAEDDFYGALLDLAPEYLPPDELGGPDDDSEVVDEWNRMIDATLGAN